MRRRAEEARVIVVNHHLFFADLATRGLHGGGGIIPPYDAVIFDEAHQMEDVVTQFFGVSVGSARLEALVRDAARALAVGVEAVDARRVVDHAAMTCAAFFGALAHAHGPVDGGRVPLGHDQLGRAVTDAMFAADNALDALAAMATRRVAESEAVASVARRASALRDDIATILDERGTSPGRVAWLETRGRRVSIGASPVDVSEVLRSELFGRTRSVVLTSATLSAGGKFDFVKQRLGLDEDAREEVLASPFDYERQAALYVASDLPDPRDPAHAARATQRIRELLDVTGGGAFVLCTSVRAMETFARALAPALPWPSWTQGDGPKTALLEHFRRARNGVLFATASFWEGVDVTGDALRLVIIDRLPFDVPTDPLVSARCERLRERGEQPFMRYVVPAAALTLKQGFGRLIRTARDRGIVAILDPRVVQKGYGKVFLRSLPEARRCETMDQVAQFWEGARAS
jgi:ATP-dependent DNA helicase DinG